MRNSAFACPYLSIQDRANCSGSFAPANSILDLLTRDFHGLQPFVKRSLEVRVVTRYHGLSVRL